MFFLFFFFKEADVLLRDTLEAERWCKTQTFKGTVSLPIVIGMDKEDRITTLMELWLYNGPDDEENIVLMEPFMFSFQLQSDYEIFCVEALDNRKIKVFASFVCNNVQSTFSLSACLYGIVCLHSHKASK